MEHYRPRLIAFQGSTAPVCMQLVKSLTPLKITGQVILEDGQR